MSLARNPARLLGALAVILNGSACASVEPRFVSVETRTTTLEARISDLQEAHDNMISRLVQIQQEIQNAMQPLRTQQADRGEDLRSLQRQVIALEEELAMTERRIGELTEAMSSGMTSGGSTADLGFAIPPPRGATVAPSTSQGRPEAIRPNEADRLFRTAYTDYLRENYDLAIQGFRGYINRFPNSARADNAQFWVGECYFAQNDFVSARQAFLDVSTQFPDGDFVAAAALNAALALIELGDNSAAASELIKLVNKYPASDEAGVACLQLDRLGLDKPQECPTLLRLLPINGVATPTTVP